MSNTNTNQTVSSQASEILVDGLAEANQAAFADIGDLERQVKRAERQLAKDAAFYAKYPHVKEDSLRTPTEADLEVLVKSHGRVCTVLCACGEERTINTQDAFQVQACRVCQDANKKDQARARRAIKRNSKLAELSPEELAAKKEELANRLELLQATS